MGSVQRRYSKEEFARRGDAIFEKDVRPQLRADDTGEFAAIDIDSGAYEIDADELKAGNRLRARVPEAQIWMVRVGHRSAHRIGGRWRRQMAPALLRGDPARLSGLGGSEQTASRDGQRIAIVAARAMLSVGL